MACVADRIQEPMNQLLSRTESDDLNLDYDPISVYSEKQGGAVMKASDTYRESLFMQEWVSTKVTTRVDNLCR